MDEKLSMTLRIAVMVLFVGFNIEIQAAQVDKNMEKESSALAYLAFVKNYWQVFVMNIDKKTNHQVTRSKYDKSTISWYPDAKHLLVNSNDGKLYKINTHSGEEIELNSSKKGMVDAVIAPTGKYIAFSLMNPNDIKDFNIWLIDSNGKNPRQITKMKWLQHQPTWGTKGEWLYFVSGKGSEEHDIWRTSLVTKAKEKLTRSNVYHFDVAVSKNNDIAYSGNSSGNYEIWVRSLSGQPKMLTNNESIDANPAWSPNAEKIAFVSAMNGIPNIWIMDKNGENKVQLTNNKVGARAVVWAPN